MGYKKGDKVRVIKPPTYRGYGGKVFKLSKQHLAVGDVTVVTDGPDSLGDVVVRYPRSGDLDTAWIDPACLEPADLEETVTTADLHVGDEVTVTLRGTVDQVRARQIDVSTPLGRWTQCIEDGATTITRHKRAAKPLPTEHGATFRATYSDEPDVLDVVVAVVAGKVRYLMWNPKYGVNSPQYVVVDDPADKITVVES